LDEAEEEDIADESAEHAPRVDIVLVEDLLEQVRAIDLHVSARDIKSLSQINLPCETIDGPLREKEGGKVSDGDRERERETER
jgi:hypothetical protein